MRPQKAYNIISRAFKYYWNDGKYHHFFSTHFREALIKCFHHYHTLPQKRLNAIVERMDAFKIPHSTNLHKDIENLWDMVNSFQEKVTDRINPLYTLPTDRLSYLSDRWNAPNRIAFILWVITNYTPDELSAIREFSKNPDVEIREYEPINQIDEVYQEPTYVDLVSLTDEEFSKLRYFKKIKRFGKVWMGRNRHIREYDLAYYDTDPRTVTEMKHNSLYSRKWIWLADTTTRYQPK